MSNEPQIISKSLARVIKCDITDRNGTVVAEQNIHDFITRGYKMESCRTEILLTPHPQNVAQMEQRIILIAVFVDYNNLHR